MNDYPTGFIDMDLVGFASGDRFVLYKKVPLEPGARAYATPSRYVVLDRVTGRRHKVNTLKTADCIVHHGTTGEECGPWFAGKPACAPKVKWEPQPFHRVWKL